MPQVPIDWFRGYEGGQNLYAGKAERQWRTLHGITQGMFDLGYLLRKSRNRGLPPGATDEDLEAQEQKLETELGGAQAQVRDDTTHGVERASTQGDVQGADNIRRNPAEYAASKHDEKQGFFPKLGNFMKTGVERLVFGDPKRGQRLSHIHQMEGQLQAEKDKENFLKSTGQLCMKSEDPDRCLAEMGAGKYGIHHLPKMQAKPTLAQQLQDQGIVPPPDKSMGGSAQDRRDQDIATRNVRQKHGGTLPTDPNQARLEVDEEVNRLRDSRTSAKDHAREAQRKREFDYKRFAMAADREQLEARRAAAKAANADTITESWSGWRDVNGKVWQFDDAAAARLQLQFPNWGLVKVKYSAKRPRQQSPAGGGGGGGGGGAPPQTAAPSAAPQEEADPGDEWGVKFFAPLRDERGGQ